MAAAEMAGGTHFHLNEKHAHIQNAGAYGLGDESYHIPGIHGDHIHADGRTTGESNSYVHPGFADNGYGSNERANITVQGPGTIRFTYVDIEDSVPLEDRDYAVWAGDTLKYVAGSNADYFPFPELAYDWVKVSPAFVMEDVDVEEVGDSDTETWTRTDP